MTEYLVFSHWFPKPGKADELLTHFTPILSYAKGQSEEIPCLYLLKEDKKPSDEIEVLTIACFKNEQIYKQFITSPAYTNLHSKCTSSSLLLSPPKDEPMNLTTGFPYRPLYTDSSPTPFTVIASIIYEPNTISSGAQHWKVVADEVEKVEEGTWTYCFLRSAEGKGKGEGGRDVLYSLERYRDRKYFEEVHCKSEVIRENMVRQKEIRTPGGLSHRFWVQVGCSRLP